MATHPADNSHSDDAHPVNSLPARDDPPRRDLPEEPPLRLVETDLELEADPAPPAATFYLTGIRVDGRRDRPDFFTFLIEQDGQMLPLVHDGQVLLFTNLSLADEALVLAGISVEFRALSFENVYLIDVSQALFLLQSQSVDENKTLANVLDLFARILTTLGVGVPPVFADALIEFGSYVDQNTFYGDFIEQKQITRHRMIDATRWCLGTVFSLARILTPEE